MRLSIIIPCYNERDTLEALVERVKAAELDGSIREREIVLVDDGSTDGSREIMEERLSKEVDHVIYHSKNMGKGAALRSALPLTSGDIVIFQDADLEYDPRYYQRLIEPIMRHGADVVYGSRFMGSEPHRVIYFWHMAGNRVITTLSNLFTNLNLTDVETCYKAFRGEIIRSMKIEEDGFGVEVEITAKLAKKGYVFYEVGIPYYGRTYEQGKKITWRDGIKALYLIMKYNLWHR
jgi:glycosyltransferase involved in cell wall biosynthesis